MASGGQSDVSWSVYCDTWLQQSTFVLLDVARSCLVCPWWIYSNGVRFGDASSELPLTASQFSASFAFKPVQRPLDVRNAVSCRRIAQSTLWRPLMNLVALGTKTHYRAAASGSGPYHANKHTLRSTPSPLTHGTIEHLERLTANRNHGAHDMADEVIPALHYISYACSLTINTHPKARYFTCAQDAS